MSITIDFFKEDDREAWTPLWDDNNQGLGKDEVTDVTWSRLMDDDFPIHGIGAYDESGVMVGFLHYVLHPTTGSIEPVCYMQDVFVPESHRKQGIAKQLVVSLAGLGQEKKWARMYWLAANNNVAAQALYKNLGVKLDFSLFVLPLQ